MLIMADFIFFPQFLFKIEMQSKKVFGKITISHTHIDKYSLIDFMNGMYVHLFYIKKIYISVYLNFHTLQCRSRQEF